MRQELKLPTEVISVMVAQGYISQQVSRLKEGLMKTVGKCKECKDPVYDFQSKQSGATKSLHAGCLQVKGE